MRPFVTTPSAKTAAWRPAARTGFGAVPALGGLCWAVVAWEARRARSGPRPYELPLPGTAVLGPTGPAPIRIVWLGDSLAAGLGVDSVDQTPAHVVAHMLERAVDLTVHAVPGARVRHVLDLQLPQLADDVDLVVVCVGANDVAAARSRRRFAADLDVLLTSLAPRPTVLLSLPDMAMADRLAEPLRTLAGRRARWFDRARARVASAHRHVTSVDIAARPHGVSRREGRAMLCADRFHPGPLGYRVWAERIATECDRLLDVAQSATDSVRHHHHQAAFN